GWIHALRKGPRVLPEQIAGGGVDGLYFVAEAVGEQDSVVNQRRAFVWAGGKGPAPGDAQGFDGGAVDLLERAEALVVESSAPSEPCAGGGTREHGVGDRSVFVEWVRGFYFDEFV